MKGYYKILNLSRNCTEQEIKSAYRKLAQEWHPDKNNASNAQEKFIEIHEAYEFLSDPEKRKLYDNLKTQSNTVVVSKPTTEQKQKYEKFEKEAHMKAEYYSKVSFDKYFTDFLSGIDKAQTGCAYMFGAGFGLMLLVTGFYGFIQMIIAFDKDLPWWRYPLGFVVTGLAMFFGFRLLRIIFHQSK